jgi:hypothetical protein
MNIYARAASAFCLLSTLAGVPATHSAEYYIYRDAKGVLVISNQKPPLGSELIRQRTLPDDADLHEASPRKEGRDARPDVSPTKAPAIR